MTGSAPSSAGWHADPTGPGTLRYWDGTGWTPHTAGATAPSRDASEPALHRTARLPEHLARAHRGLTTNAERPTAPDHTTVPVPTSTTTTARPDPVHRIAVAGTLTAAASLVVACAALGIALAG
jgi:hypothetical protein